MSRRPGRVALSLTLSVLSVLPAVAVVTTAAPSRAAASYTWTGAESALWGTAANWSPAVVPTDGDTVLVAPAPSGRNAVSGVPDVALAGLTVDGDVSLTGAGQVSAAQLQWTGGDLDLDLTVGSGSITQATTMLYGGARRTLTITGQVDVTTGSASTLEFRFDSSLRVAGTGTLRLGTGVRLLSNRCCTGDTGTVVVNGTIEVDAPGAPGTARLDQFGLDLVGGDVVVPAGSTLEHVRGPVRVDDATATGGGTFRVTETAGDAFDPLHPLDPDGTLKFLDDGDTLTLAGGSTLALGDLATVSGVGRVAGDGLVLLAGPDVRGDLTLDVPASTVAGTTTRITVWDDVRGQQGVLRPEGGLAIVPTSALRVHSGTVLTVPDGARVSLRGGATLSSDGCCSDPGRVVLAPAGTVAIGGASPDPAVLEWVTLGGSGQVTHSGTSEWDLAAQALTSGARVSGTGTIRGDLLTGAARVTPVGVLTVDGDFVPSNAGTYAPTLPASRSGATAPSRLEVTGTARLAGVLAPRGTTTFDPGHQVLALRAGTTTGRFRCALAPGLLPVYSGTAVRLRAIEARVAGCLVPASGRVLRATFDGRRTAALGVPAGTDQVLLQVTLGRASRAHTLSLAAGGGRVVLRAGARRAVTRLVVVPVAAARRLTATTSRRAAVTVTLVGRV